jgi:hypothetical protein
MDNSRNPHDNPAALKELQDAIYRDKVLRARGMSPEQRLEEAFDLSNRQMGMMLAGAMHRLGTDDEAKGWAEVRRWMERLDRARDHGLYVTEEQRRTA